MLLLLLQTSGGGGAVLILVRPATIGQGNEMYLRNTAGHLGFNLVDTSGADLEGATVSVFRVRDNGAQAAATGSVTDKGNGQYNLAMSAADTDGDVVSFLFTASGAISTEKTILTTGVRLTADGADDVEIEDGINLRQSLALIGAACAGKGSGLDTATATYYAMGGADSRIVATIDGYGNRSAVAVTPPA